MVRLPRNWTGGFLLLHNVIIVYSSNTHRFFRLDGSVSAAELDTFIIELKPSP